MSDAVLNEESSAKAYVGGEHTIYGIRRNLPIEATSHKRLQNSIMRNSCYNQYTLASKKISLVYHISNTFSANSMKRNRSRITWFHHCQQRLLWIIQFCGNFILFHFFLKKRLSVVKTAHTPPPNFSLQFTKTEDKKQRTSCLHSFL